MQLMNLDILLNLLILDNELCDVVQFHHDKHQLCHREFNLHDHKPMIRMTLNTNGGCNLFFYFFFILMKISLYFISIGLSIAILSLSSCTDQNKNTASNASTMRTVHVEANRIDYKNFPDLKKSSDFVGIVQPTEDFQTRKHENNYMPDGSLSDFYTRTTVRVIKVFKGDVLPNSTMEIIEPISIIKSG